MTTVVIRKDQNGRICAFTASGHASDDLVAGQDIYCAAVSALTQTACMGLEQVAGAKVKVKIRDGFLSASVSREEAAREACQTIFQTLALGLASMRDAYPEHLQIIEEVQKT